MSRIKRLAALGSASAMLALASVGAVSTATASADTICYVNGNYGVGMYDGNAVWQRNTTVGAAFIFQSIWPVNHNGVTWALGYLAGENPNWKYLMIRQTLTC